MSNEDCPNCSGHTQLDCLRDYFGGTLAELLRDTLEKVRAVTQEDTPEVKDRKEAFSIELAEHLLWLAAAVYSGEGYRGSEAIYELARALEEVESEPDEDEEPVEIDPPILSLVTRNDVN